MRHIKDSKLAAGFLLILLFLIVNAGVSTLNMRNVSDGRISVVQNLKVSVAINDILSTLQDAETGQRGYLLTGRAEYLEPYFHAVATIHSRIADLRALAHDSAQIQSRIADLDTAVSQKLGELNSTIELRRRGDAEGAKRIVLTGHGLIYMQRIRDIVREMTHYEQILIDQRTFASISSEEEARLAFAIATIVGVLLLIAVFGVITRSNTERQQSAEALQRREQWLSTTLKSIGDAVIATDDRGALLFMNDSAQQLTGWNQEDAQGKDAASIFIPVSPVTRDAIANPINHVLETANQTELSDHAILIGKDNRETYIDDTAAPIRDASGRMIGVVLVFRDVGEQKAAQDQRARHIDEVEALNYRLKLGIQETHHRIKNNLQSVISLLEMQKDDGLHGPISVDAINECIVQIKTMALVHDLLSHESDANEVDARLILHNLVALLTEALPQSANTWNIDLQAESWLLPARKATALALIVNELVSNSNKHGRGDKRIDSHADISILFFKNTDDLVLEVVDRGRGFPPDFDVQSYANLGLALVMSLVENDLGGKASFNSPPGPDGAAAGATVTITF